MIYIRPTNSASAQRGGWRDCIPVHPAADELFPLMSDVELVELGEDIKKQGLIVPIIVWRAPNGEDFLLDGRNRLDAMARVGIEFELRPIPNGWEIFFPDDDPPNLPTLYGIDVISDIDPYEYVVSANLLRRHLTAEAKREAIAKWLKRNPSKTDRQIAKLTHTSPTFVGKVRKWGEARGDVSTVDTRTDSKGRRQPAHKAKQTNSEDAISTAEYPANARTAAYAAEEEQLDNVAKHADVSAPSAEPTNLEAWIAVQLARSYEDRAAALYELMLCLDLSLSHLDEAHDNYRRKIASAAQ
jgi:hypothetical protein